MHFFRECASFSISTDHQPRQGFHRRTNQLDVLSCWQLRAIPACRTSSRYRKNISPNDSQECITVPCFSSAFYSLAANRTEIELRPSSQSTGEGTYARDSACISALVFSSRIRVRIRIHFDQKIITPTCEVCQGVFFTTKMIAGSMPENSSRVGYVQAIRGSRGVRTNYAAHSEFCTVLPSWISMEALSLYLSESSSSN